MYFCITSRIWAVMTKFIWNQDPRICPIAKFYEERKMPQFGTKNTLWVFLGWNLKIILSCLKWYFEIIFLLTPLENTSTLLPFSLIFLKTHKHIDTIKFNDNDIASIIKLLNLKKKLMELIIFWLMWLRYVVIL